MLEVEDIVPGYESIFERRRSSLVDHVNRIRAANSKRQSVPWGEHMQERSSRNFKGPIEKRRVTLSEFKRRSSHANRSEFADSLENLHTNESIKKNPKKNYLLPNKISLDSVKPSLSGKFDASNKNSKIQAKAHSKSISRKYEMNSENKTKKNARKGAKNIETRRNSKAPAVKMKKISIVSKQQNKEEKIDENDMLKNTSFSKNNSSNLEIFMNQNKAHTSKDIIVLKWLHNLECPGVIKQNVVGNTDMSENTKKVPIRILRRPLNSPFRENLETTTGKTSSSIRKQSSSNIRSKGAENMDMNNQGSERKSVVRSSESAEVKNNVADIDFNEYESEEQMNASVENVRDIPDVEMHVSELEKLQIIVNLKSLSPEDAAVIIWLDDLPKSFWKPDYRRRFSITSIKDKNPPKQSETVLKSHSVQSLEDLAAPRPNIYFPSITVLKNFAVDSKEGLDDLNEDFLNSVYYKRCNLSHTDLAHINE